MGAKESADAKAKGSQDEREMSVADAFFLQVLYEKRKISKNEAGYSTNETQQRQSCVKCKFNLGDEGKCHVVKGKINNEKGVSKFF